MTHVMIAYYYSGDGNDYDAGNEGHTEGKGECGGGGERRKCRGPR